MAQDDVFEDPRERRIWAKGHRVMQERGYNRPGREEEAAQFAEQMAAFFPRQREAWLAEAAQWRTPQPMVEREAAPTLEEMLEAVQVTRRWRRERDQGQTVRTGMSW